MSAAPVSGGRKILPLRAVAACPMCGGKLAANTHWSENVLSTFIGIAVAIPFLFGSWLGKVVIFWWAVAAIATAASMLAFFHLKYWRRSQRYRIYEPPNSA